MVKKLTKIQAKLLVMLILISVSLEKGFSQQTAYKDRRPLATFRIPCDDEGVVMRHGNGPDSCDTYGAREAIVNKVGDTYSLFYDGAGSKGWLACLAQSKDLKNWDKKGPILSLGESGQSDSKSASSPWVIKQGNLWHMFYLGTPNASRPPDRVPSFPYLTMKAVSPNIYGPWRKQYDVIPFPRKEGSYYSTTSSPGFIVFNKKEYLQFFSASVEINGKTKRTLGLATTTDLDTSWKVSEEPIFPIEEQIENSSLYYQSSDKTWFLFTNHIGINDQGSEYTDAIWVYWSKDLRKWDAKNKAIVMDKLNCKWAKGAIGMPTVIRVGNKLAMLYDASAGDGIGHMHRDIALAWMPLPIVPYQAK